MSTLSVLMFGSVTLLGLDPAQEEVIARLRDHFDRIESVHVRGIDRAVASGGLWDENPTTARPVYKNSVIREFDYWIEPPRQYRRVTEKRLNADGGIKSVRDGATYFDGQTYTNLNLSHRSGLQMKGGSLVRPIPEGPIQAIGYCFTDTYHTSLAALLSDSAKVSMKALPQVDGGAQWLIRVKSIPEEVRPLDLSDKARSLFEVYIWVTVEPEVIIHQWGQYLPRTNDAKKDKFFFGRAIPSFQQDGLHLHYGYVNTYESHTVPDELRHRRIRMPVRVLHGNGNATMESELREMAINPKAGPKTFAPDIPRGYNLTRLNETANSELTITGGEHGSAVRVREISSEARSMLASGEVLRAPPNRVWPWAIPFLIVLPALGGAGLFVWLRRRKTV